MADFTPIPGTDTLPPGFPAPPGDNQPNPPDAITEQTVPLETLLHLVRQQPDGEARVAAADGAADLPSFWQVLCRSNTWKDGSSYAFFVGANAPLLVDFCVVLEPASTSRGPQDTTSIVSNPCAVACFDIPATGWYVINLVGSTQDAPITAWTFVSGTGWVQETVFAAGSDDHNHPLLLNLAAGTHWLCFTVGSGSAIIVYLTAQSIVTT